MLQTVESRPIAPPSPVRAPQNGPRISVNIATRGRPKVLGETIAHLAHQTSPAASMAIACTSTDDVGDLGSEADVRVIVAEPGLARQRNALLREVPCDTEIVVFFDDDFVPRNDWLAAVGRAFAARPDVVCVTGHVIADGILGPGLSFDEARRAIDADEDVGDIDWVVEGRTPYGCNMAFRADAIRHLRFDERLVLYGWLEDQDFGSALALAGGNLLKIGAARGVHMGVKTGRVAGDKLGYSQVMNPIYLNRKGTMSRIATAERVFRNVAANVRHALTPEPFIDRRGRLRGNAKACLDLCRGRITPERAETL